MLARSQIAQIYQQLRAHHSKDPFFLRRLRAEMAASDAYPWLCRCGRRNRKTMDYCPSCTRHWRTGTPIEQNEERSYATWSEDQRGWDAPWVHSGSSPRQRTTSPRQRQPKKNRRKKNKTQMDADGRNQSRGRGPASAQQPLTPPPPPPLPTAPQWAHLQNTVPLADPPAPVTSQEAQQLKECVALLHKYEEGLPPEVQSYVQGIKAKDVKRSVKTLHSAVTSMGRSRDELQAAIAARSQMHSTWRTFLADSITRFQAYGQDFATQEENLVARIQEAKKAFEQAKENLSVEKAKASSLDTTVQEVSDEETEIKDVVLAAPDKITESLNHLTSSLEGLRSQAADLEKEEQKHKRPRLADAESAKPGSGDAAMPSFG